MENLGFVAALGTALAWGTYMVPFKKSHSGNLVQFQLLITVGIGLSGLIAVLILGYSLNLNIYGLLSGVLWAMANAIFLVAVSNLGITKAVPVSSSLVIISSFLWGSLVFGEMQGIAVGLVAIGLIIAGVVLISTIGSNNSLNKKKGLVAAVLAGLIWGSQLVPLKVGHVATRDFFFPACLGILITGAAFFLAKRIPLKKEAIKESLLSGVIWNTGNLLSLVSLSIIGLSKAGPISQVSTLVAVIWGLFYFKEVTDVKAKLQVLIGAIILLGGVIVLGLA
ncbi:GRP family sugar transporter [Patescibacteria group bacterium]|nr:GRP family sugar transporter [Patescibacteria group bacterium]